MLEHMRRASKLNDQFGYCRSDAAFHAKMVELSGNPLLSPIWDALSRATLVLLMNERQPDFD
ncbi:FCD domain-containing protein [Ensifer sp. ENS06]|uniref:FCD domain-containing protein n=1 Tax=Ensifer sp. ENS06 TaxID=2769276 RepID=UPI00177AD8D0|nr:FCD domain-containing protein [Ensifer sp. ENS06]